jgi:Na+-driven multidrug efflux pump
VRAGLCCEALRVSRSGYYQIMVAGGALLFGSSFLVPFIYPNVGQDVLHFTFWGLIIAACVQPAKVLNSILGNGILPSGGDTKYILISHVIGSYVIGVLAAIFSGFFLHLSVWGVFGSRALEEMLKAIFFLRRYRTPAWYKKSVDELSNTHRTPRHPVQSP